MAAVFVETPVCSLIPPHLDHHFKDCILHLKRDIEHLERLQRLAAGMVTGFKRIIYVQQLYRLPLPRLKVRRQLADLHIAYKTFPDNLDLSINH